jgi:hypothetical protein
MKICIKCKVPKSESEFNKKSTSKDGLAYRCKECTRIDVRNCYQKRKEYYKNVSKIHRSNMMDFLKEQKNVPCKDCNIKYPYYVMDFDHIKNKKFNVGMTWKSKGRLQIIEELKNCEVVCANCHRIRTHIKRKKRI